MLKGESAFYNIDIADMCIYIILASQNSANIIDVLVTDMAS